MMKRRDRIFLALMLGAGGLWLLFSGMWTVLERTGML